jgi:8-oxo-dGTP pyrophosphatase MutT (NUDIX family)
VRWSIYAYVLLSAICAKLLFLLKGELFMNKRDKRELKVLTILKILELRFRLTIFVFIFLTSFVFIQKAVSAEPLFGCRVKPEVIKSTAHLSNNAGCLITKGKGKNLKVMMLYTRKDKGGYAFPGGTIATMKNDIDEAKEEKNTTAALLLEAAKKNGIKDYHEPIVCTAARETKEETGLDVIVGDLFVEQKYFIVFKCYAHPSQFLDGIKPLDTHEVKTGALRWISKKDFKKMKDGEKGKTKERFVYQNVDILRKVFE